MLDNVQHADIVDWTAIGVALGALFSILPHASALLSFVWLAIRIYETKTVQKYLKKRAR